MKKYLIASMLTLALSSGVALAEGTTTLKVASSTRAGALLKIQQLKDRIASSSEKAREVRSEIENRLGKKLDEQRLKIAKEFEQALKNVKKLADRVEEVIVKLESKGNDLSSQRALLADAKAKISVAESDVTALENALSATTTLTTRKEVLKSVKTQVEKTKADLKAAHKAVVKVITSLKPGREEKKQATSTEATSTATTSDTSATSSSN